jgi:RNA polymerase sigma factor (sigma-70 family)
MFAVVPASERPKRGWIGSTPEGSKHLSASLLAQVAAGDQAAVRECLSRYGSLVWSLAKRYTRNATDAEDAVQEIFIDLWRNAVRFDPRIASEPTFVTLLARRRLIDRQRRDGRRPGEAELPDSLPSKDTGAAEIAEIQDEAARATAALNGLNTDQRQALQLSIHRGYTHEEIATALKLPLGTIKTHLRRGLIRLREILVEAPGDPLPKGESR